MRQWVEQARVIFGPADHLALWITDRLTRVDGALPAEFRWRIHNDDGAVTTEINARYDTDLVFGIGQGWIGGYSYNGHHDGKPITGTGYIEYVRTRLTAPNPTQRSVTAASKSPTAQIATPSPKPNSPGFK